MMTTVIQLLYFDTNYAYRWASLSSCLVFNAYFFIYNLFIFYDLAKYGKTEYGSKNYEYYVIVYGSFLKNIRYE